MTCSTFPEVASSYASAYKWSGSLNATTCTPVQETSSGTWTLSQFPSHPPYTPIPTPVSNDSTGRRYGLDWRGECMDLDWIVDKFPNELPFQQCQPRCVLPAVWQAPADYVTATIKSYVDEPDDATANPTLGFAHTEIQESSLASPSAAVSPTSVSGVTVPTPVPVSAHVETTEASFSEASGASMQASKMSLALPQTGPDAKQPASTTASETAQGGDNAGSPTRPSTPILQAPQSSFSAAVPAASQDRGAIGTLDEPGNASDQPPSTTEGSGLGAILAGLSRLAQQESSTPSPGNVEPTAPSAGGLSSARPPPTVVQSTATTPSGDAVAVAVTPVPGIGIAIGDQTLTPAGPPITVSGSVFSLAPSATALIINSFATPIPSSALDGTAAFTAGDATLTPVSIAPSEAVVGGQTIIAGGTAVIVSDTTYSLPPSPTAILVNGTPNAFPGSISAAAAMPTAGLITLGTQVVSYSPATTTQDAVVVGSQIISAGGSAITAGQRTLSLAPGGFLVVASGSTTSTAVIAAATSITVDGQTVPISPLESAVDAFGIIVAGQTLLPGSAAITAAGQTLSLASGGSLFIASGGITSTATLQYTASVTIGSQTFAVTPLTGLAGGVVVAGQTLHPGSAGVTIAGQIISLAPDGSDIVVGSGTARVTEGIGGAIMSGLNGPSTADTSASTTAGSTVEPFTGSAIGLESCTAVGWTKVWALGLSLLCALF